MSAGAAHHLTVTVRGPRRRSVRQFEAPNVVRGAERRGLAEANGAEESAGLGRR